MSTRNHVVITGTGRSGTTFLVELLTRLGLDTGFSEDNLDSNINKISYAGLEHNIEDEDSPFIIKSPWFCEYAETILCRDDINIEHIFIPVRKLYDAAESRRHVSQQNENMGGLLQTQSYEQGDQEAVLTNQIYKLVLAVSRTMVPVTFMHFPRTTQDSSYLFNKLKPILDGVPFEIFNLEWRKTVRPELIHSFSKEII